MAEPHKQVRLCFFIHPTPTPQPRQAHITPFRRKHAKSAVFSKLMKRPTFARKKLCLV